MLLKMSKAQGPRSEAPWPALRPMLGRPARESLALVIAAFLVAFALPASIAADARFGVLPLYFEANRGQTDERVQFFARGREHTIYLGADGAAIALRQNDPSDGGNDTAGGRVSPSPLLSWGEGRGEGKFKTPFTNPVVRLVRMSLIGANPNPAPAGQEKFPGRVNYLLGNNSSQWQQAVPHVRQSSIRSGLSRSGSGLLRQRAGVGI